MSPVETIQTGAIPVQTSFTAGNSPMIPMSTLIEYGVQRTYHELTILSELLPRKTDLERKVEIVQFASRTRQLFIRLLALVKWANSARKVDRCSEICSFLEQQSGLFIDTADTLARMSRETLVNARLPNFSLPCAVDILTTGSYPRLPACIREKIVPPNPISREEKEETLKRLDQVIEYRLVSTDMPKQMRRLRIENGRVKFFVEHEFEATLTLMGDTSSIPWSLLDITFLVEDHETGKGRKLVHSLQVHYIHKLVQCRLRENDRPLHDLYQVLHSFCQSLQLEVLHSQTQRVMAERLRDNIHVEQYAVGHCLTISYWREQLKKNVKGGDLPDVYKVSIRKCVDYPSKPLIIQHHPPLSPEDSARVGLAIKSDHLSIEKLLIHTIEVRSLSRLKDLIKDIRRHIVGKPEISDVPPVLCVPLFSPCLSCDVLRIGIDIQRGTYLVSMQSYDDNSIREIQDILNSDKQNIESSLAKLQKHIAAVRCKSSIQHLSTQCHSTLPLSNLTTHPLSKLTNIILYIAIPRQPNYYLVVQLDQTTKQPGYKYFLLAVSQSECASDGDSDESRLSLQAGVFMPLNTFSITHGPFTKLCEKKSDNDSLQRKRKLLIGDCTEPVKKKPKTSSYLNSDLAFLLSHCEEKLPFVFLIEELDKQDVSHSGIQVDGDGISLCLTITRLPDIPGQTSRLNERLRKSLLSCTFRTLNKPQKNFLLEFLFLDPPLRGTLAKERGLVQRVFFLLDCTNMEKAVDTLLSEWMAIGMLFSLLVDFSHRYNSGAYQHLVIQSYDYKHLVFAYGASHTQMMSLFWRSSDKRYHIQPGTIGEATTDSCHAPVITMLEDMLNLSQDLTLFSYTLCETAAPMVALAKLRSSIVYKVANAKHAELNFVVIPQSPTHIRVAFRKQYVIDVYCKAGGVVGVRDGAYSVYDSSKVIDGFWPISGLKAFLNLFVDESLYVTQSRHGPSTADDDNPPSPIGTDSLDNMFMSQSSGSPAARLVEAGIRLPVTPPSNPHTPASPSTKLSAPHGYNSPATAFPLTSPPSIPSHPNPSPAQLIGTPSPAQFLSGGSPLPTQLHVPSPGFVAAPSPAQLHIQSPATSFLAGANESNSPYPGSNLSMPAPSPIARLGTTMSPGYSTLHSPQTQAHKDITDYRMPASSSSGVNRHVPRVLPARLWAASIPTLLSHDAFSRLCTPSISAMDGGVAYSPLEKFLGCVACRKHITRLVNTEEHLTPLQSTESGAFMFKIDSLQFRLYLNPSTLQTLHLEVTPPPEYRDQWNQEELQCLERYFESRVVCPPYRMNTVLAFLRMLGTPMRILKDCIQIMRHELVGPDRNYKWHVQFLLTFPHGIQLTVQPGMSAFVYKNSKMICALQFTYIGQALPGQTIPRIIHTPLMYNNTTNTIGLMDNPSNQMSTSSPILSPVSLMLKRFNMAFNQQSTDCVFYPAVRDLMANLTITSS